LKRKKVKKKGDVKSAHPLTFYVGVNLKPKPILSFLKLVENLFNGEFSKKEKVRAIFLLTLPHEAHV
jgi:hypothetical protein